MSLPRIAVACVALIALVLSAACEDTSHASIDKWMNTSKGPAKLKAALRDGSLDPDLSAHAAENLIRLNDTATVVEVVGGLAEPRRAKVLAALGPRLWKLARIEGELLEPNALQLAAKDAMYELRASADEAARAQLDGYLVEWFTGGYYEARATRGRWSGAQVLRAVGPAAGEKMIAAANAVVSAPVKDGGRLTIGDQLMLGLAVTAHPDAVKYVFDIMGMERGDKTLAERAIGALARAFLEPPDAAFEVVDGAVLTPHVGQLAKVAKDGASSARMANDAINLIRIVGPPHCIEPLVSMVAHPHDSDRFVWVGTSNALRCGGVDAIVPVAEAIPTSGSYHHEDLQGSVVGEIARISPAARALDEARKLLDSRSWVARWVGIEVIGKLGTKDDAVRLDALAKDKARLVGYWGDQDELPKKERKAEPTLGKQAATVAAALRARP